MDFLYTEEAWGPLLKEQEEKLVYESFSREQALELGISIEKLAREKYHGSVAIRIIIEDLDVFTHRMTGSIKDADWWMQNKYITARFVRMSSLRALVAARYGEINPFLWNLTNSYVCGGCFPILNKNGGRPHGFVVISGMKHFEDHQCIADAMAQQLGVEIPDICAKKEKAKSKK